MVREAFQLLREFAHDVRASRAGQLGKLLQRVF